MMVLGLGGLSPIGRGAYSGNMHRSGNFLKIQTLLVFLFSSAAQAAVFDPFCNTGDLSPFMSEVTNELLLQSSPNSATKSKETPRFPEFQTVENNFKIFSKDYCKKTDSQKARLLQEYASLKNQPGLIQKALNQCFSDCRKVSTTYSNSSRLCDKACGMVKQKIEYFSFGMSFQEGLECDNASGKRASSPKSPEGPSESRNR